MARRIPDSKPPQPVVILKLEDALLEGVERFRAKQRPIPPRLHAVVALIRAGLAVEQGELTA